MVASCYILHSKKRNKFYIGVTHASVEQRIEMHNSHGYGKHRYTAIADDWSVYLILEASDYSHAVRIERKIKSMKSRVFIQNLKKYPELRQKIMKQTSI